MGTEDRPVTDKGDTHATPAPEFDDVDRRALAGIPADEMSLDALSTYLARGCTTDREKTRAVYRWVTDRIAYDMDWLGDSIRYPLAQNPDAILVKKKTDCVGYANLFVALATRMGVKADRIDGYFKLPEHTPGEKVFRTHTWNGVEIGGQRFLLDPTLGAGRGEGGTFVKHFNEHFFLIDPKKWIRHFFPKDENWQALKTPVLRHAFEAEPYMPIDWC